MTQRFLFVLHKIQESTWTWAVLLGEAHGGSRRLRACRQDCQELSIAWNISYSMVQGPEVHSMGASWWGLWWGRETEGLQELPNCRRSPCWRWWSSWSGCSPDCQQIGYRDLKLKNFLWDIYKWVNKYEEKALTWLVNCIWSYPSGIGQRFGAKQMAML